MSDVSERVRQVLLKDQADRLATRCEKMHEHIASVYERGDEPSQQLLAEFDQACKDAEVAYLGLFMIGEAQEP